jgi:hypothetical protein
MSKQTRCPHSVATGADSAIERHGPGSGSTRLVRRLELSKGEPEMNSHSPDSHLLIQRLKRRASDPEQRTDFRQSRFDQRVSGLGLGGLLLEGLKAASDLGRVVRANQQGEAVPSDLMSRSDDIAAEMNAPASAGLPPPASQGSIQSAESELGFQLPDLLRRVYGEVADGGFGPALGLLSLASAVALYREMAGGGSAPVRQEWPRYLLPILKDSAVFFCVDAASPEGRVIVWDPEGLSEFASASEWSDSFSQEAASLEDWLRDWLESPGPEQQFHMMFGDQIRASQIEMARESRAHIAAMTPEERAAMGLPEVGWEEVVWGGLGWDPDEEQGSP